MSKAERDHPAYQYGKDADYLRWLSFQPSCVDGSWNQWDSEKGCGRNIAAHVRTVAAGAGVGAKPPYSAVPLTDTQHRLTHQHGNSYFAPPEWWAEQAAIHLERWIQSRKMID